MLLLTVAIGGVLASCREPDAVMGRAPSAACGGAADAVAPLPLVAGSGAVESLAAAASPTGASLETASALVVRAGLTGPSNPPQIVIDTDDDRGTGMWTLQSPLSASGWDVLVDQRGKLYRHQGAPNEWRWSAVDANSVFTLSADELRLCVPISLLGDHGDRVRIAVITGDHDWLPAVFLPGAAFGPEDAVPPSEERTLLPPQPLAFHYGFRPWAVRSCSDSAPVSCAAGVYANFRNVVFGSGLEDASHASHKRAATLVRAVRSASPQTEVWGYVSLVGPPAADGRRPSIHTVDEVRRRAAAWKAMGATGIFLDEADLCRPGSQPCPRGPNGQPVAIDRARQVAVVGAIHSLGLPVFANGFAVPDVLGPVDGTPSPLGGPVRGRAADMFLLENSTVSAGQLLTGLDDEASSARWALAQEARARTGVRLAAVDTLAGRADDVGPSALYRLGLGRAADAGLDAYGFTNSSYSSRPDMATDLALPVANLGPLPGSTP